MSAEKSKKAEAFATAWSPEKSEIRSPGKQSPGSSASAVQSLASPKATVSASATADAIMRATEKDTDATKTMEAVKRSPRKSIDAFLQATPPKAAGDYAN